MYGGVPKFAAASRFSITIVLLPAVSSPAGISNAALVHGASEKSAAVPLYDSHGFAPAKTLTPLTRMLISQLPAHSSSSPATSSTEDPDCGESSVNDNVARG